MSGHDEKRNGSPRREAPDALLLALAAAARSAVRNHQAAAAYAITHGEPLCEPCACQAELDGSRCVCRVELAMTRTWMRSASQRIDRGEYVGESPRRRCKLCRSGDHDLVPTYEVKVSMVGSDTIRVFRMPEVGRRNRRQEVDRAKRAGGHPAGTREAQRKAAGIG